MNTAVSSYFFITPEPAYSSAGSRSREAELDQRERALKDQWKAFEAQAREREAFIATSEARLAEKIEAQQDRELELEQKVEDLERLERQLKQRESALESPTAPALA